MGIKIGLIGAGRMGKVFAHTLAFNVPEADLVAIADHHPELAQEAAARYNAPSWYADYRPLLERKDIEAVVVATSTATHVEVAVAAAAAGKQIFCEKPLALDLAGNDVVIEAARQAGVRLQVGLNRHFDPAYVAAKQMIDDGKIGTPVMIKLVGRDPRRTGLDFARRENSGGMILDMGIHDFDTARWLMGSEVERVSTEGGCLVYPELKDVGDIDNAVINLRFTNGTIGNVDLSRNSIYGHDVRSEILGSKGGLIVGKDRYTDVVVMTENNIAHDTVPYFMERFSTAYAEEIRGFIACIVAGREPAVTGADARAAMKIGLAATKSLDESRPVLVSEIG
jgi:scyllo-inositol 2-dehydrogenase (NAD+)